jgi:hypothetical protein
VLAKPEANRLLARAKISQAQALVLHERSSIEPLPCHLNERLLADDCHPKAGRPLSSPFSPVHSPTPAPPEQIRVSAIDRLRPSGLMKQGHNSMKKMIVLAMVAGLATVSACNSSPRENAADTIEANSEAVADNLEDAADNAGTPAAENSLENKADAVRATGQNQADDMRTNDPDTNLSNGI